MRNYDLTPLFRSTVGFDRLNRLLEAASTVDEAPAYPPYNIEKLSDDDYRITMAVAGFGRDDIDMVVKQNTLTVTGKGKNKAKDDGVTYLHRGIATRSFERRFDLAEHIEVKDATLTDGMLTVELQRRVPEALKPRTIEIRDLEAGKTIDHDSKKAA
ncbi:MAG: Hsp20 family protein [Pseudomonadota bacterium]